MKRAAIVAFVSAGLASCQAAGVVKDVHMGSEAAYGPEVLAYYAIFESMKVQPFYSTRSGYGFTTFHATLYKDPTLEAWSYGKQFEFTKGRTEKTTCLVQPCVPVTQELGEVAMDEADFLNAAKNGLEFELVGKRSKVVGTIPATAFQKVLEQKNKLRPAAPAVAGAAGPGVPQAATKTEEMAIDDES